MADLALNDSLIDEYLKYKFQDNYNPSLMQKLFKFIQPFSLRNNHSLMNDPAMAMQLENDPLIEVVDACNDDELVSGTILKLMLVDSFVKTSYRTLAINNTFEKLKPKYVGAYPNKVDKNIAQNHIKALLSDAKKIHIIDSYIAKDNYQWSENIKLLGNIIPNSNLDLIIESGSQYKKNGKTVINEAKISEKQKDELKKVCKVKQIISKQLNTDSIHDRYIKTDKLRILLSSGLFNLSSTSDKDFTYVVEVV